MKKEFHQFANIFPLMEGEEFTDLVTDIKNNGLIEPIALHEDKILDGRNRYNACQKAGVEPKFYQWKGADALEWVMSKNLKRRHLNPSQRAIIGARYEQAFAVEAKKREQAGQQAGGYARHGNFSRVEILPPSIKARDQAGRVVSVSGRMVSDAKKIINENPGIVETIMKGEKTISEVKREIKRTHDVDVARQTPKLETYVEGQKFKVVLIDPPWSVEDEGDINQMGRANPDYATMTIDEIEKLPIGDIADKNAHIYLWITNRSLPKGFRLLEKWGFRYVTILTWCKPSIGIGNYFRNNTEHILFGVRGNLSLLRHDVGTWFEATRGKEHSSKPEEIYKIIESCSPPPYIEIFARTDRKGWATWGANNNAKL